MHIVVVGAGLIGITSAYRLRQAGHAVTVIEQEPAVARGASRANGGLLTPSMADPWNAPGFWKHLVRSMGHADAPLLLRPHAIPSLLSWGMRFISASTSSRYAENTARNLRLAAYSVHGMDTLRRTEHLEYGASTHGTMKIYRDRASFEAGSRKAREYSSVAEVRPLDATQAIALEPALGGIEDDLSGALHFPGDEAGDAQQFTEALSEVARRQGVHFSFGMHATGIIADSKIHALKTSEGEIDADALVVAAGCHSTALLRDIGIRLPVVPVKGYSLTCNSATAGPLPSLRIPVVDDALHAAVTPLGDQIRIAGTAEFTGFDTRPSVARIDNLRRLLRSVLPRQADRLLSGTVTPWAGLRPMSADGVPFIGPCGPAGLFVNTGHGHLGWTMADGSARLLTDLIEGHQPALPVDDYSPRRFE